VSGHGPDPSRPHPVRALRIAALLKQVPVAESLELGPDGRLRRAGAALEMNAYCRRAVSKGTELAGLSGGSCTLFTLGPESAEDALREGIAWGADDGVHLCDKAFAGSDTLATARALAGALDLEGPFDLILVGRNSIDGDTGQVGPEVAELAGLPFASGVRQFGLVGERLQLRLEHDDGWSEVELDLPAVLSVAERLCEPCKVEPEGRRAVSADRLRRLSASDLGSGPWGDAGSPTKVGAIRTLHHQRMTRVLTGDLVAQVAEAVGLMGERGALTPGQVPDAGAADLAEEAARSQSSSVAIDVASDPSDGRPPLGVVVIEPGRPRVGAELLGATARLAAGVGGWVVAVCPPGTVGTARLGDLGADEVVHLTGGGTAEDVAAALVGWSNERSPWTIVAPSTAFGREVAGRAAAALSAGLVGDAIGLEVVDGVLVAAKPAFSGALIADITWTSPAQLVTVRPGVLPVPAPRRHDAQRSGYRGPSRGRVRVVSEGRDDDVEVLARAEVVIGVGSGVQPDEYERLSPLAAILGAELAATRKVTDKGWAPRARQVGLTGRSIAPRLYVALGLSGKFNHMVGVRAAGTILAINSDREAPVFGFCDIGLVGDWHDVLPGLEEALRQHTAGVAKAGVAVDPSVG